MNDFNVWGLNLLWATWGAAVWLADLNYIIALIGGFTLIWVNLERIITERKKRKK
tara:strand:+ start:482 stop:646 length:165 start_codon:yes stop_codon:yes gene_type:complete